MFVVKPLADGAEPRAFISSAAANVSQFAD